MDEEFKPGNAVKVTSKIGVFRGIQLGFIVSKCKGMDGWLVKIANPELVTKYYCISRENGDTIERLTRKGLTKNG